jgi:hypothetical protein
MLALPKVEFLKTARDGIDTISAYVASINIISSAQKGENKYPAVRIVREKLIRGDMLREVDREISMRY